MLTFWSQFAPWNPSRFRVGPTCSPDGPSKSVKNWVFDTLGPLAASRVANFFFFFLLSPQVALWCPTLPTSSAEELQTSIFVGPPMQLSRVCVAKRATTLGQSGRPGGLRLLVEARYNQQNRSSCVSGSILFLCKNPPRSPK